MQDPRHFSPNDAEVLHDVLRWRRDVRHFKPDPIPAQVMTRLRAAVDLAPSVGNARPWKFLSVRNPARRAAVAATFEKENSRAAKAYNNADRDEYIALKLAGLRDAPEHIAVFTDTDPVEGRGLGRQTMPEMLAYSTVTAIHTLWLAARVENLGVGWVSILDPKKITQIFEVPEHWRFTAYLCLGQPQFTDDTPLLHRTGWQENTPTPWAEV
ncbi:5,6-dimethylbenzimidazole synthase [Meridianimarinicoccus aquatilis]|uniref:5,6-dimethylbenzimidazole synthase n=1 Tax=Meridianimarinicoccus aquatilis TaxID=2552766 RepID=A0A4R6B5B1_9RHOB|nr:5,6-dimethylbenzimidazole synthase [Fluviibacterium aquatile]TDL90966.1 5,6-dimethylbenzimidazole synthase [Fluviibacterium aquatile]